MSRFGWICVAVALAHYGCVKQSGTSPPLPERECAGSWALVVHNNTEYVVEVVVGYANAGYVAAVLSPGEQSQPLSTGTQYPWVRTADSSQRLDPRHDRVGYERICVAKGA